MKKKEPIKIKFVTALILILIGLVVVCGVVVFILKNKNNNIFNVSSNGKIDDWQFSNSMTSYKNTTGVYAGNTYSNSTSSNSSGGFNPSTFSGAATASDSASFSTSESTIGYSTGGAKDVNNFRENIKNGYFPISTDITYNGLFYDYTFDTGKTEESTELFSPSYSTAISNDPISNSKDYYMTVGLNSNIKESDFQRKKLNLVVVLDISGSMSSRFNSYYYDQKDEEEDNTKTKMQIANQAVGTLIDQLNEDDRFGMVLFDSEAYLGKPISKVEETDMEAIKNHILEINAAGGTNFESGYTKATELFKEYQKDSEYENRIIIVTDAMPNVGTTSKKGLLSYVQNNADDKIYTTFIGVGVDFNTELIEKISDVKGANYYSVHNKKEFEERMGEQFEYMVTPLVFDLKLDLESDAFEITSVYGSDTVNKENGNIMNVNTLFPSKTTSDGEVKGGVILLKLNKKTDNDVGELKLNVSYKDRDEQEYSNSKKVTIDKNAEYYDNSGIRKAIVLTRYANTLKDWILYERSQNKRILIAENTGIIDCNITKEEVYKFLGENERTSVKLTVSDEYKNVFNIVKNYISEENTDIKDNTLNQEIEILDKLIK